MFLVRFRDERAPVFKGRPTNAERNDFDVFLLLRERSTQLGDKPGRLRRPVDDDLVADNDDALRAENAARANNPRRNKRDET